MIFPEGIWTEQDDVGARDILNSPTWQKMLSIMMLNKPKVSDDPKLPDEVVARQSRAGATWDNCLNMFAAFSNLSGASSQEYELDQIDTSKPFSSKPMEKK